MSDLSVHHLMREHREVEKALDELECMLTEQKMDADWGAEEREDFEWVAGVLGKHLVHHIQKEEQLLFPVLEAYLPRDIGPLDVLRGEHSNLRFTFDRLCVTAEERSDGAADDETVREFQLYGASLLRMVRDHIYKEDRVLFPMVARFLAPDRDAELLRQMEEIDHAAGPERAADK
ncbi:MAG: hemerythrin domain-containing protein [Acidobacteria bacterium]|nr:hemerythrin domain-containing protein [Acidobacteriota bacterium]